MKRKIQKNQKLKIANKQINKCSTKSPIKKRAFFINTKQLFFIYLTLTKNQHKLSFFDVWLLLKIYASLN